MSSNEYSASLRIRLDDLRHPILEILFKRRILDNRHHQYLIVSQILLRLLILDPLDHLQMSASEFFSRVQKGDQQGRLGVGVDDGPSISGGIGAHEERRALALAQPFLGGRQLEVASLDVLHEYVVVLDSLFLDGGRGDVDLVVMLYAYSTALNQSQMYQVDRLRLLHILSIKLIDQYNNTQSINHFCYY